MNDLDLTWLSFGLFLLACGLVPVVLSWADARRADALRAARLFHEPVRAVTPVRAAWPGTISRHVA